MFCKNCGKNTGDFEFCPYCGTKTSAPEKVIQQPVVVSQMNITEKPVRPSKPVKALPQSPKESRNVFIVGLMSMIIFALPIVLYFGYLWFLDFVLNRSLQYENYKNLAYMIPVGSLISVIIAIIAKKLFKGYITYNEDYPKGVRTGRVLYTIAFTISTVLLSFFCIDRLCYFIL